MKAIFQRLVMAWVCLTRRSFVIVLAKDLDELGEAISQLELHQIRLRGEKVMEELSVKTTDALVNRSHNRPT